MNVLFIYRIRKSSIFFLKQTENKFRYQSVISNIYKNSKQAVSDESISVEAECDLNHVCYLFDNKNIHKENKIGQIFILKH